MSFEEMVRPGAAADVAATTTPRRGLELRRPPRPIAGGMPRVSLLPPVMRDAERMRGVRRVLVVVVVVTALAAAADVAGASAIAGAAEASVVAETQRSQQLGTQIAKFAALQKLQQRIALAQAAVRVGSSTEIDWQKQLNAIEADMPDGFTVTTVTADGATPIADYVQGSSPLDRPRAATVTLTLAAESIDLLPVWLRKLRSIPSYADVIPEVTAGADGAGFTVQLTIHLNKNAIVAKSAKESAP